ncbi:MAG: peptidoglycan-binding protein [Cyanobacteria bacterium REEB444]|nr:peptidoglycan-binding protein [Cyanobacteria bacterium REEB444]
MSERVWDGPNLNPWEVGAAVAELQELLCAHGFLLRVDGNYGYITEKAVKQFQTRHHLRPDGVVGRTTWQALKATVKPGMRVLRLGHTGVDVWMMQGLLQVNGHEVARTGIFDSTTEYQVRLFQQRHQLGVTGKVERGTWGMLCNGRSLDNL